MSEDQTDWTTKALVAGGILTVRTAIRRKSMMQAKMKCPGEKAILGKISLSMNGALDNLEAALAQDCAEEMKSREQ
jgi:hypothetical protein